MLICTMAWQADLHIAYACTVGADGTNPGHPACTRAHARHSGPYRVLKALYPEGPTVCHHTLLHPPSGLVGGDTLNLTLEVGEGAHALLTTPGASRFYRSTGALAEQRVVARVAAGAKLEWLPQENIVGSGALALNAQRFELAEDAQMMGWDLLALGLAESGAPFVAGRYTQHLELPGLWLEHGVVDAADTLLLSSPLGLAGQHALATLWWAGGSPISDATAAVLVDAARAVMATQAQHEAMQIAQVSAGVTRVSPHVVVLRALGRQVEPLRRLLNAVRRQWRVALWNLDAPDPRVWST